MWGQRKWKLTPLSCFESSGEPKVLALIISAPINSLCCIGRPSFLSGRNDGFNEGGTNRYSVDGNRAKPRNIFDIKWTSENSQLTMANDVHHTLISNL
jgi:hypothetical protein